MNRNEVNLNILASVEPEAAITLNIDKALVNSPNMRGGITIVVHRGGDLLVITPGLPTVRINLYSLAGGATALAERYEEGSN